MSARWLLCAFGVLLIFGLGQQWACAPYLCQSDSDCASASPERPHCHYAKCKACVEDRHCPSGQRCADGVCLRSGEASPDEDASPRDEGASPDGGVEPVMTDSSEPSTQPEDLDEPRAEIFPEPGDEPVVDGPASCPSTCSQDSDCRRCSGKGVCFKGVCVAPSCPSDCTEDSHCQLCGNNLKACDVEPDCTNPNGCRGNCVDPTCRSYCTQDADCSGCPNGANLCDIDPTSGMGFGGCSRFKCPEMCKTDGDCKTCEQGNICNSASQQCDGWSPCESDVDCKDRAQTPSKPYCNTGSGACFECKANSDCATTSKPVCEPASRACVACLSDGDCTIASKSKCNLTRRICVECLKDGDCLGGGVCSSNVCKAKRGRLCDTTGKIAPKQCLEGSCTFIPGLGSRQTYCYLLCNPTADNCPKPLTCIKTSASTTTGHCLESGCSEDDDCGPAFPSFKCLIHSDSHGKVCAPPLVSTAGTKILGQSCNPQGSLCGAGLICLSVGNSSRGYCTASCLLDKHCGKFPTGEPMTCLSIHGELRYCGAGCTGALSCPTGMICTTRPKKICAP